MHTILKYAKVAAAAVTLIAASAGAQAATVGQPVTIDEGAIKDGTTRLRTVDQLGGFYDEVFTITGANTFVTEAIFRASGWAYNGSPVSSRVNGDETDDVRAYDLYAKFSAKGTFANTGTLANPVFQFNGGESAIEVWADADQNTTYDIKDFATGNINNLTLVAGSVTTDDQLLGSASFLLVGEGNSKPGVANGNFELIFGDFNLNGPVGQNGDGYFKGPRPFYVVLDLNGNFQSFNPLTTTNIQLRNNVANAFFMKVPEPGALALVGIALVGMGLASRRNRKA